MLEALILRWGYAAITVGTFFEGEAVLIAGGALAQRGLLSLPWVIASAFLGGVLGDQVWFRMGRRFGPPFIERHPRWKARVARNEVWLARYGSLFVLGFRFIYGVRSVTPLFLGVSSYPLGRFTVLNAIGAAFWAVGFGAGGWLLGASLDTILQRASRVEELIGAAVGVVFAAWIASVWLRRARTRRRARHERGGDPTA